MTRPADTEEDAPLDTTTDVETPEHIHFRHRTAGPARRGLAYFVDTLIRIAILLVFVLLLRAGDVIGGGGLDKASSGVVLVCVFVLEWGYFVVCETLWNGRSPGKIAARLRVVKEGGYPITFIDSVLRNLLRAADFMPLGYALGLAVMTRDRRFRRLGDLVAGTMVIVEESARVSARLEISPPPRKMEMDPFPQRIVLSSDELDALELFLRRYGTLSTAREEELAVMVAPIFARRLGLRFQDATRFLQLLYHRASGADRRSPSAPASRNPFAPPPSRDGRPGNPFA